MALKFNGDLSTGDATQFSGGETDASSIGTITADAGDVFDSAYYYSVALGVSGQVAYFTEATTLSGQYKALRGKFKFSLSDTNIVNSSRNITLLQCNGAGTYEFALGILSVSLGEITQLQVRYRNSAGSSVTTDIRTIALTDNTVHEIEFHWRSGETGVSNSGIARVWLDGVEIGTGVGLDIGPTRYITSALFGCVENTVSQSRTLSVGDFKLASNSDYSTDATDYYVDYNAGSEINEGTATSPWKYAMQANQFADDGDSIVIVPGTAMNPLRLSQIGVIKPARAGSANNMVIVRGNSADAHTTILGTISFPPASWTGPDGNGEYSISVSSYTSATPSRIYVCTENDWQSRGYLAIDPRVVGLNSVRTTAGTPGALAAGEWAYNAGTVYYKPQSGETFSALHIEIPCRTSANAYLVDIATNYVMCKWIDGLFAVTSCLAATANGTGSVIYDCDGVSPAVAGIQNSGSACMIYRSKGRYAVNLGESSGDGILCNGAGTGKVIANICHDNANDGIAFSGTHASTCVGNVSFNNGHAETGNECGIEITGDAVVTCYHNTCVGNHDHGILLQSTVALAQDLANNVCAYNGTYGINISATHAASVMNYNSAYGHGVNFNLVGTGAQSPTGAVTGDPLFTSVDSTTGNQTSRSTDDYTLAANSPCRETTDATSIIERYWTTGPRPECQDNPVPDRRACMGAYQG